MWGATLEENLGVHFRVSATANQTRGEQKKSDIENVSFFLRYRTP